jgi:FKBP-type peptidyl-prolyl cis-trans isomerase FklB
MIVNEKRTTLRACVAFSWILVPWITAACQATARPAATIAVSDIQLTFKKDPRLVDPTRNPQEWVPGPNFGGASAQDTVETVARAVDSKGQPVKATLDWIPSDPEMVTISPSQGDHVKITVRRAGESSLKITTQGFSKDLVVQAKYTGNFILVQITQPAAPKPAAPAAAQAPPKPKSKDDVSYAAGMNVAKALQEQSVDVNVALLVQGIKDTFSGDKTRMTEGEALAVLEGLQIDQRIVEAGLNRKALAEKNKREGQAFLATNKTNEGVVTLPSGLQYKIIAAGAGKRPTADDLVKVHYRGTFIDGKEFDSSLKRGPMTIPVKGVVKGLSEALQVMPVGSRWRLFLPPDLAYGERGGGTSGGRKARSRRPQIVGPNATLIFDVELLSIEKPGSQPPVSRGVERAELTREAIEQIKKLTRVSAKHP